jgi:hypothetical protein
MAMNKSKQEGFFAGNDTSGLSRRKFLGYAGGLAGAGLLIASCDKDDDEPGIELANDLGSADEGLLNCAYVFTQLKAAFYTKLLSAKYTGMNDIETWMFNDMLDHSITHREWYKNFLIKNSILNINPLEFDFSSVDFSDRASVVNASKNIEELISAGYISICKSMISSNYLLSVGKIASVSTRHAATVNDIVKWGSFADTADQNGQEVAWRPVDVLAALDKYFKTKVSSKNLPKK